MATPISNTVQELLNQAARYIGLGEFHLEAFLYQDTPYDVGVALRKVFKPGPMLDPRDPKALAALIIPTFVDAVQNSDAVKAAKYELTKEVDGLKTTIEALQKENARLREFETYYKLQYTMKHGEKP